jgi:hypothetical protein
MPDDQAMLSGNGVETALRELVPPVLMALGAILLFRSSRVLALAVLGAWTYDAVARTEEGRVQRQRNIGARRAKDESVDQMVEDSFPASDPPSSHGATAGAP